MNKCSLLLLFIISGYSFANVSLPSVFSDHMVLQQNEDVKFWGWANPSEEVIIKPSWTDEVFKVKTNNTAHWEVLIKTPNYGGPFTITITGYNVITLNNILIGEVWLCSGQSNMEMTANWGGGIKDGEEESKMANHPNIRFFNVPKISAVYPQDNLLAHWEICSPQTMKNNSAVAYFFGEKLQEQLSDVPIGLVISAWGCAPAEIWIPKEVIVNDPMLSKAGELLKVEDCGQKEYGSAYNAMIYPLSRYSIAGAIWYQGESNVGAKNYDKTFSAVIKSWRELWKKEFPFYFVQISPYQYGNDHFGGVEIRNAQRKVADEVANTGMVVIDDVTRIDNIHPIDKKPVGIRLANLALKKHYKVIDGLVESPQFKKVSFNKEKAEVYFNYSEGIYLKNNSSLFEIAGDDQIFYAAKVKLKKDYLELHSNKVKSPKYVRYAWGNTMQSNIFNEANLPASSFTTEY